MLILALSHEHNINISALCKLFKMPRSSFYYHNCDFRKDDELIALTKKLFIDSEQNYGTRKLKVDLAEHNHKISRRRIARFMASEDLVSSYTKSSYRPSGTQSVKADYPNIVNQEFDNREEREVMVSDTTYLWINNKWHYLCIMLDLCGRFLEGFCASETKDATMTQRAILSIKGDLRDIGILHSDKGSEYINQLVDKTLRAFDITRSTSGKGNAYDNAVAESMFKIIKTEFVKDRIFYSLEEFTQAFSKWVYKYNNIRVHGSLDYLTPAAYRKRRKETIKDILPEKCEAFSRCGA
jgi:transposase InsO family protein